MKSLALLPLLLLAILPLHAQSAQAHFQAAAAALARQDYATAFDAYQAGLHEQPDNTVALYHAARCAAQLGQTETAFDLLDRAFPAGEEWLVASRHLESAPELAPLRELARWSAFMALVEQRQTEVRTGPYAAVKAELLVLLEADQSTRKRLDQAEETHGRDSPEVQALWQEMDANDARNQAKLEAILERHGWLGPKQVGPEASSAIFLVIQHADLARQKKYLPQLRAAVQAGRAQPFMLAMLEDRVELRENRPQIYGSQIGYDEATAGYYVLPLSDPDRVDERRRAVGLPLLADYVKQWKIEWDVEAYKRQLPTLKNTFVP